MDNPFNWKIARHDGKKMHEGANVLIKRGDKILLLLRRFPPFGWAPVGGHIDKGENPEQALIREVSEEIGAKPLNVKFLFNIADRAGCYFYQHFTHVYSCEIDREPVLNFESKNFGWFGPEDLAKLKLTQVTTDILKQLRII